MSNLENEDKDLLSLADKKFKSRLFIGSGKYSSDSLIPSIVKASASELITIALRRVDFNTDKDNIIKNIPENIKILVNTSGARNADEAVRIARLARASGCSDWIKIEVISDNIYLLPDGYETLKASRILVKEGFKVFPYINPDLMLAKALRDVGVSAIMPLGSPIGSNRGLKTKEMIEILIDEIELPIIVDAGIGKPSHACEAMEMGAAACLMNTAIASSDKPAEMAAAFAKAIEAGRSAYLAGLGPVSRKAVASSPLTGFLGER